MAQKIDPREEFYLAHDLIGTLVQFPPFSIDQDMRRQFQKEMTQAIEGLIQSNASDSEWNAAHNPLMEKYATELEEASLWNARSGRDSEEAKKLALALEGKTPEEINTYLFLS
jgi:hypothetical protein